MNEQQQKNPKTDAATAIRAKISKPQNFEEPSLRAEYGPVAGFDTPWRRLGGGNFILEDFCLTILSGLTGVGKSLILNQLLVHAAWQGRKVMIASMEMPGAKTLKRLIPTVLGKSDYTLAERFAAHDWINEQFIIYDHVGSAKIEDILAAFEIARLEMGVTVFVIDSLMCLSADRDWAKQESIAATIATWSNNRPVHNFLVAHNGKPDKRAPAGAPESSYDIMGGSGIPGYGNYVATLSRMKTKEIELKRHSDGNGFGPWLMAETAKYGQRAASLRDASVEKQREDYEEYIAAVFNLKDATLSFTKVREGGGEGELSLWYDDDSKSFGDHKGFRPNNYLTGDIPNQSRSVERRNSNAIHLETYDRNSLTAEVERRALIARGGQISMNFTPIPELPPAKENNFPCDIPEEEVIDCPF